MHELGLTQSLIDLVQREAEKQGFRKTLEIRMKLGEYSDVIPDCIEEFFPLVATGTAAENARLVMNTVKAEFECRDCGFRGTLEKHEACCPTCGSMEIRMTAGREFYVENLIVE